MDSISGPVMQHNAPEAPNIDSRSDIARAVHGLLHPQWGVGLPSHDEDSAALPHPSQDSQGGLYNDRARCGCKWHHVAAVFKSEL